MIYEGLASCAGTSRSEGSKYMRSSKSIFLAGILIVAAAWPGAAQETPFATPPLQDPGQSTAAVSALSDIMSKVQLRHIKLWYAIKGRNWDLVGYELGHLRDTFETAVILYRNIPIELIASTDKALGALQEAAQSKSVAASEQSFAALTASCNACHEAAAIGFVFIQTPTSLPFSNQKFGAAKR
jgi:antitoxin component of RelBE/YafQ-DinJ toxin-antitoxin module